jgi:hypothetical protein
MAKKGGKTRYYDDGKSGVFPQAVFERVATCPGLPNKDGKNSPNHDCVGAEKCPSSIRFVLDCGGKKYTIDIGQIINCLDFLGCVTDGGKAIFPEIPEIWWREVGEKYGFDFTERKLKEGDSGNGDV